MKKETKNINNIFISLVFILVGIVLCYLYMTYYKSTETLTVNAFGYSSEDSSYPYLTFQVKYSSKYFVTSDDMLTSYDTQGGSARPRLVFTTGKQYLDMDSDLGNDYIEIWSTGGYSDLDEWIINSNHSSYDIVSEDEIDRGDFVIEKYVVKYGDSSSSNMVAFISLPEDTSYFFECGSGVSEKDFDEILNSFELRAYAEIE